MTSEWKTILEILIASGTGAGVVVFIDGIVKYYLYKKRNFQEALSIQLSLNQMLAWSLQIRRACNQQEATSLKFYGDNKIPGEPSGLWINFRHIDLPPFIKTIDDINYDWDFTQFLTGKDNKNRDILKYLITSKLGYQSLLFKLVRCQPKFGYFQQAQDKAFLI